MYVCMYRLSYERGGNISFITRGTMSYFITYLYLYLGQKSDYIFTLFIL